MLFRVYEYFLGKFALKESSGKGKGEFANLLKAEAQSKKDLLNVFKELGYEIKL